MHTDPKPAKIARTEVRKDMAEFVSKLASLPFVPMEKKVFDNLSQCEDLLFDPSIKQAFLLPLFHFLRKETLRVHIPLSAYHDRSDSSSSSDPAGPSFAVNSKNGYKYWVICTEGLDLVEAMRKQKKQDGTPLYGPEVISRLVDRYSKTWWKVQKHEYEEIQKAVKMNALNPNSASAPYEPVVLRLNSIQKKLIEDKFTKDDVTLLIPSVSVVASVY